MSHDQAFIHPSESWRNQILDNLDAMIWSLTLPDLTPIYFNAVAAEIYQCDREALLANPQLWCELIVQDDQSKMQAAIAQAQRHGTAKISYRLRQHGKTQWISARLKVFQNASGLPIRIDVIAHKVHKAPKLLRRNNAQLGNRSNAVIFEKVVQQQKDLILRSLPDTTITFANHALCQMLGCSLEQIIGQKWIDFANPDDLQSILRDIASLCPENPSFIAENRDRRADDKIGWTQWINQGIFNEQGELIEIQSVGRDITELKLSETFLKQLNTELELKIQQRTNALNKIESRNLVILHTLPDLLLLLKPDGTCLECILPTTNSKSQYLPIKHHISEVLSEETLNEQLKLYQKAIATGEVQVYEHQLIKFGKIVYEEVRIAPYSQDELLVIVRDITDRKLAEQQLQNVTERLTLALRSAKLGIWEWDIGNNMLIWDERTYELYGVNSDSSVDNYISWSSRVHPDDLAATELAVQEALKGEKDYEVEFRVRLPEGKIRYLKAYAIIQRNELGEAQRMIGINFDISDLKLAEAESALSRDLRESIFNESPDALFLVDSTTLLTTDCNLPAVSLFEASDKSDLIGIEGHILQRYQFTPEELEEISDDLQSKGFWSKEVEYVGLQGRYFWGNLAVKTLVVAGKSINLVRVTDISDRKQAEAHILKTSHQLESTNRELESFCYSVSHDLRAPLRHINGFVNALKQQLKKHPSLNDPKVDHYLQVIDSSSQKMGHLIDGLLILSRFGRKPLESQSISVRELVDDAITLICSDPQYNSNIEFAIGKLPNIVGDPTLLHQVFHNLIDNAVKFSRHQPKPYIEIDSLPNGTIRIKDNGAGFQMEYADKLFGAFQRLHNEKEFEGTGIGLAIVQRIIQRHGGSIWAESQPNQGATFFIKF